MWVCVHGDLGMWQWLGGPEAFSELEDWTQLQRVSFPVEMSGVLMGASGNLRLLVLESRPLRRDAWKPTKGFR